MPILGVVDSGKSGHLVTGAFESIATLNGNGSAASITFSSIPSTYNHLQIRMIVRDGASNNSQYQLWFNSGASATYATHIIRGNGSTAYAGAFGVGGTEMQYAAQTTATTANVFGASIIDIIDYASTSKNKTVRAFNGYNNNTTGSGYVYLVSSLWVSTSAVNAITIYNSNNDGLEIGSTFALYGIKG